MKEYGYKIRDQDAVYFITFGSRMGRCIYKKNLFRYCIRKPAILR
jgi:hypothetical protein